MEFKASVSDLATHKEVCIKDAGLGYFSNRRTVRCEFRGRGG